jgi:site-specific DNA-methyltransferase (cytosine-N4-specific)
MSHGLEALAEVDWDFARMSTNGLTHSIHPYPAKFIPQIPAELIRTLSVEGETVGDIFSGSGTTLVEALRLGRHAIGVDANPLACLITDAKTTRLTSEGEHELSSLIGRARAFASNLGGTSPLFGSGCSFRSAAARPVSDRLTFWFEPHVIEELAEILSWCRSVSPNATPLALTSFSAIVVAVSKQDSDTRYVRREKAISSGDVFRRFARTLESNLERAVLARTAFDPRCTAASVQASVLDEPAVPPLDLMVCSPPYPNAYSYHLYHMTRMLWLGMDQQSFKAAEIGSHRKYSSKSRMAADVETFRSEFEIICRWLATVLRPDRYACFVVGNSTIRGTNVNNADVISSAAATAGFVECARFTRRLQDTKKAFNPAIGKIKTEYILVLRNAGGATCK